MVRQAQWVAGAGQGGQQAVTDMGVAFSARLSAGGGVGHARGASAMIGPSWTPGRKRTSPPQDGGWSGAVRMYGAHAAIGIRVRRTIKRDPRSVRGPGRLARKTGETVLAGAVGVHHPQVSGVAIDDLGAVGGPLRPIVLPRRAGQLAQPRPVRVHHVDAELAPFTMVKAILGPSGDQSGYCASYAWLVSRIGSLPSAFIT